MGFFDLKKKGILGINSRNLDYIIPYNKRKFYKCVDDKLVTKDLALAAGIPVPALYAVIEYQKQLSQLDEILSGHKDFVIKPAQGSGGGGILVIKGRTTANYIRSSGKTIATAEIHYHISNILSGLYALGGLRDKAIIESRVENIPLFDRLAYQGVPDIRLIMYHGVPAMAMLRLPTHASNGRANLHIGGIGVGLCLRTGTTIQGVLEGQFIENHSDTDTPLAGLKIPQWQDLLEMGVKTAGITGLGYLGVDIVLDKTHGPMLLEANARPGIAIQISNRTGLKARLRQIEEALPSLKTEDKKIAFARTHFGIFDA